MRRMVLVLAAVTLLTASAGWGRTIRRDRKIGPPIYIVHPDVP